MPDVEETGEEPETSGPVSRRKIGSSTSGWCIMRDEDSHARCPISVGSFVCGCPCLNHGTRTGLDPVWIGRDLELLLDSEEV